MSVVFLAYLETFLVNCGRYAMQPEELMKFLEIFHLIYALGMCAMRHAAVVCGPWFAQECGTHQHMHAVRGKVETKKLPKNHFSAKLNVQMWRSRHSSISPKKTNLQEKRQFSN